MASTAGKSREAPPPSSPAPLSSASQESFGLPTPRPAEESKWKLNHGLAYDGETNESGEWHGRGALKVANGDFYEGTFVDGELEGEGYVRYARGSTYEGQFVAGLQEGVGTLKYKEGGSYEGEWKAGRRHGQGTSYYASGNTFEGEYEAGKRVNLGTWRYADGTVEVNFYQNDQAVGEGVRWNQLDKNNVWDENNEWRAWKLVDGRKGEEISLDEARTIAQGEEPYLIS